MLLQEHDLYITQHCSLKTNLKAIWNLGVSKVSLTTLALTDKIDGHYSLKNQFEQSATSVGANIREANYAQCKADFVSKLQITLKKCYETEYCLELFVKANVISTEKAKSIMHACGEIRRMLIASVNTLKSK